MVSVSAVHDLGDRLPDQRIDFAGADAELLQCIQHQAGHFVLFID